MNTLTSLFGGRSKAEKQAEQAASDAQVRASRASEEDAALSAANQSAAARLARAQGKRVLAFQGLSTGVPAGGPATGQAPTLGG